MDERRSTRRRRPASGSPSPASRSTSRCSSCCGRSPAASTSWSSPTAASTARPSTPARAPHGARPVDVQPVLLRQRRGRRRARRLPPAARRRAVRRRATASRRCGRPSATSTPSAAPTRTRRSTGAALAAITKHVAIRAGSVVLPLHSPDPRRRGVGGRRQPLDGRVGISFAAGLAAQRLRAQPGELTPTARRTCRSDIDTRAAAVARRDGRAARPRRQAGRRAHAAAAGAARAAGLAHVGRHRRRRSSGPARSAPTCSPTCSASRSSSSRDEDRALPRRVARRRASRARAASR